MKKFILGLGTLASAVAPVAAVVACGTDSNGLPTLSAKESTTIFRSFASVLGVTMPSQNDAFQIKFSKLDKDGIQFTIERTDKTSSSPIAIANLEKTAGTALAWAAEETLNVNLVFNAGHTALSTKEFKLSGSKTTAKNGAYTAKAGTLADADLITVIKQIIAQVLGIDKTIASLSAPQLTQVTGALTSTTASAEVIFADAPMSTTGSSFSSSLANASAKLVAHVTPDGKFDFTFELTAKSGGFIVMSESRGEWLDVASTKKATIHLVGAMAESGFTLTTKEATSESKKVTLNAVGAKKLAMILYSIASAA